MFHSIASLIFINLLNPNENKNFHKNTKKNDTNKRFGNFFFILFTSLTVKDLILTNFQNGFVVNIERNSKFISEKYNI